MCTRSARGSPRHDGRTGTGELGGLGEGPGNNGLAEGDSETGKHQGSNFGSTVYRSVPTTPWSPGIQQLIGNPHNARL